MARAATQRQYTAEVARVALVRIILFVFAAAGNVLGILAAIAALFGAEVLRGLILPLFGFSACFLFAFVCASMRVFDAPIVSLALREELRVNNPEGTSATWQSERSIIPVCRGVSQLRALVDAVGDDPQITMSLDGRSLEVAPGRERGFQREFTVNLGCSLRLFHRYTLSRQCEYAGTFVTASERFFMKAYYPALMLSFAAYYPKERTPNRVWLEIESGGSVREAGTLRQKIDIHSGGAIFTFSRFFVTPGETYFVRWTW